MKTQLRKLLSRAVAPVLRFHHRSQAAVLMFHGFTDREHDGCENGQHKHLHVKKLEAFLAFMKRHYQIVSLDDIVQCLNQGEPVPPRAVVLTFDDGFLSNYTLAYPLLKHFEAPAIIYLATEFVDEKKPVWTDRVDYAFHAAGKSLSELKAAKGTLKKLPQEDIEEAVAELEESLGFRLAGSNKAGVPDIYHGLSWDQVREMQSSGLIQFGAHTHTHKILGRCQPETVRIELATSKSLIERETLLPCEHFCYPNGGQGDFSKATEQQVAGLGFKSSLTTLNGWVAAGSSPFLIPRLGVSNDLDLQRFDLMLAGVNALAEKFSKKAANQR